MKTRIGEESSPLQLRLQLACEAHSEQIGVRGRGFKIQTPRSYFWRLTPIAFHLFSVLLKCLPSKSIRLTIQDLTPIAI